VHEDGGDVVDGGGSNVVKDGFETGLALELKVLGWGVNEYT
jgi:hypothetical protein